jgi:2-octaprenyl-6-methoxyphenol hydroxylase
MVKPKHDHYDLVIVGAGLVGASLAIALASTDLPASVRVLLVESRTLQTDVPQQPGFDARSTVLSYGSRLCYEQLLGTENNKKLKATLWQSLVSHAEPINSIHVSDKGRFGSVLMQSREEGVEALGYVIGNLELGRVLNQALLSNSRIEICAPTKVEKLEPFSEGMQLQFQGQEQLVTTHLVVLAEGGRSSLAKDLGIVIEKDNYDQSAIISTVGLSRPHQGVAFERFTQKGPLALLPLSDFEQSDGSKQPRMALVWTHKTSSIEELQALPDAELLRLLQQDFGDRLGVFNRIGIRQSYPLQLQLAKEQIRPGLILLGNAAHTLHPVAGQGFNLALRDTMVLCALLVDCLREGKNPGTAAILQRYLSKVNSDQQLTISFSDYMTRLFSSSSQRLARLRQLGMASIDLLPPLRESLIRQAMGLGSKSPRVRLAE